MDNIIKWGGDMSLTEKQKRFVDEYLIDLNATAAYKRAGYATTGNGASVNASRLLANAKIQQAIADKQQRLQQKTEMTQEWVLNNYKHIIERNRDTDPNIAKGALDSVARHLGMFKDKVDHNITGGLTVVFDELMTDE